jgi:hypothetical protein
VRRWFLAIAFVPALLASAARAHEAEPGLPSFAQEQDPDLGCCYRGKVESFDPPAWRSRQYGRLLLRVAGAASYAGLPAEGQSYAGGSFSVAYEGSYSVSPELNRWFFGDIFGVEARAHVLRSLESGPGAWLVAAGLTIPMSFAAQEYSNLERVRIPSPFGVLVPEAGVALRTPQPTSFYLRWSAPLAVLIDKNVAVELAPSVWLLYQTPTGAVTPLWQLSLSFSWRELGTPNIDVRAPASFQSL